MSRFTDAARDVFKRAVLESRRNDVNNPRVGTQDILLAMADPKMETGIVAGIFESYGINRESILRRLRSYQDYNLHFSRKVDWSRNDDPWDEKIREMAIQESRDLNHHYVGTEHILLALVKDETTLAAQALAILGAEPAEVRKKVLLLTGEWNALTAGAVRLMHPITVNAAYISSDMWSKVEIMGSADAEKFRNESIRHELSHSESSTVSVTYVHPDGRFLIDGIYCKHDTDHDGNCHLCAGRPDGCPVLRI